METMTSAERIRTAIALGKPDRVPVAPIMDFFASRYGGITQYDMFFDIGKADAALEKTLNDLGFVDGLNLNYAGMGRMLRLIFPVPPVLPGIDGVPRDAQFQFVERSVMKPEEYAQIAQRGPTRWLLDKLRENHPELRGASGMAKAFGIMLSDNMKIRRSMKRWRGRGVDFLVGPNITFIPLQMISLGLRAFNDTLYDMFRYPEELKLGTSALLKLLIREGMMQVKLSGLRRVFLAADRASASFLSPKQFEEFALPDIQEMCDYFISRGIGVLLHLDNNWAPFYHYFKSLPRGKCILNLDGSSDIFKAQEVLAGHMCIMGDVPADLLKLGEPGEVDEYCRRLIMEVGADGGFILSSGCTVPADAKPENVRAMIQSVKNYRP